MRVVHHFTHVREEGGGVPRGLFDLCDLLSRAGHEAILATSADSTFPAGWPGESGPRVAALEELGRPFELLSRSGLERATALLREADLLHLHGLWRPRNSQLAARARLLDLPYVLSPHGTLNNWSMTQRPLRKRVYYRLFERRNLLGARVVHTTADGERQQVRPWVPHDRFAVIPVGFDLRPYRQLPGTGPFARRHPQVDTATPAVLFLSRVHMKKRPEVLIEAFAILRQRGIDCQLLIAGTGEPGYLESLRELARRLDVGEQTHFLGMVVGPEKLSLYQRAALFALPTSQENFGLVLTEALACGIPVVTTRGTDIWPEIEANGGGLIAEGTPQAFAEAIARLLADRPKRQAMGEAGRAWVLRWLDDRRLAGDYVEMYEQALAA